MTEENKSARTGNVRQEPPKPPEPPAEPNEADLNAVAGGCGGCGVPHDEKRTCPD
ncbi:MAG: hypothetical protein HYX75_03830 [Acidobacteria bacterium]|nr:hypothetical protein [Acidobacteriota bacterium]